MPYTFYAAGAIAIFATVMMLTRYNAIHALLYLIVSLLAVAVIFYDIGAPFVSALEGVIYAGAIMVLFVFAVVLLNAGEIAIHQEKSWVKPGMWIGPCILAALLIAELAVALAGAGSRRMGVKVVDSKQVGMALYGPYLIGVELASMLLLGGLVAAYHLGWRESPRRSETANESDS
jgi:NADH-quinone oxidoreductase subunit J